MLLPNVEYKLELEKVVEQIRDSTTLIDICGSRAGQFIYATSDFRSVEISQCVEGVWIEFWNKGDEMPVKEMTVPDYAKAVTVSLNWLIADNQPPK